MENKLHIGIGLMCGTSHDALDMACVSFLKNQNHWTFSLIASRSVDLPPELKAKLDESTKISGLELMNLDRDFAMFCAKQVNDFLPDLVNKPSFISSHGVTIFHDPDKKLTTQIGSGAILSVKTKLPVICDFRSQDVAKGGQGAPLVPFADRLLFSEYDLALNLGGFANISYQSTTGTIGFDISPCNLILNDLANQRGFDFDDKGQLARKGIVNQTLLSQLNELDYYNAEPPKSLGYEWFESQFLPYFELEESIENKLATSVEHISQKIGVTLQNSGKCLVTGGGAFNNFLIEKIKFHSITEIIVPNTEVIQFKEAICFALLGLLRIEKNTNISRHVTGAKSDSIAGAVYLP